MDESFNSQEARTVS